MHIPEPLVQIEWIWRVAKGTFFSIKQLVSDSLSGGPWTTLWGKPTEFFFIFFFFLDLSFVLSPYTLFSELTIIYFNFSVYRLSHTSRCCIWNPLLTFIKPIRCLPGHPLPQEAFAAALPGLVSHCSLLGLTFSSQVPTTLWELTLPCVCFPFD